MTTVQDPGNQIPADAPTGSDVMRGFMPNSPFVSTLGVELVEIGDGHAVLRMPYRESNTTIGSMVHGGALGACVDLGIMAAAWGGDHVPDKLRGVTVSMSVQFVAPAQAEDVDIIATRLRQGRRLCHCRVELRGRDSGELVATGMGAYQIG